MVKLAQSISYMADNTSISNGYIVLTDKGRTKLLDAYNNNTKLKIVSAKVSSSTEQPDSSWTDLPDGWWNGTVKGVIPIDANTMQFEVYIPITEATDYGRLVGLYDSDGDLILIAKLEYPLQPSTYQYYRIAYSLGYFQSLIEFEDQTDYDLSRWQFNYVKQQIELYELLKKMLAQLSQTESAINDLRAIKTYLTDPNQSLIGWILEMLDIVQNPIQQLQDNLIELLSEAYNASIDTSAIESALSALDFSTPQSDLQQLSDLYSRYSQLLANLDNTVAKYLANPI